MDVEPSDAMVDAAHELLSSPPYLKGDKRNTRNALRAALTIMASAACKHEHGKMFLTEVGMARICSACGFQDFTKNA